MRGGPLTFYPSELLPLHELTPEQASRVTMPVFAWPAIESQVKPVLVRANVDYDPWHVGESQLNAFLDDALGADWRTAQVRSNGLWCRMLDRLEADIKEGRWVLLSDPSTCSGTGLVDWVDDPAMPDGGRWQVNSRGRRSGIDMALERQLNFVYGQRLRRVAAGREHGGGDQVVQEIKTSARQAAPFMPRALKPDTPAFAPELGDSVNELLAKSPSLQRDLKELAQDDWTFIYGEPGKGSFANRIQGKKSGIVLDGVYKSDPRGAIQTLAHEVGHARYVYTVDLSSKATCVDSFLSDEGAATLKNIEVQREILANGGPDIGIAGDPRNHAIYNRTFDSYLQSGNAGKARSEIGAVYRNDEHTSNTHQTYGNYYGDWCEPNARK